MFSYINSWLFTVFSDLMEWWKNKHILNPFCKKTLTLMCQHNESKFGNWLYPVFRFLFLKYIQISAYLVSVSFAYLTNLKQYDTKHLHNKLEKFVVIFFLPYSPVVSSPILWPPATHLWETQWIWVSVAPGLPWHKHQNAVCELQLWQKSI